MNRPRTNNIGPILRQRHGTTVRKLPLRLGATCPHLAGSAGCIFCAEPTWPDTPLPDQMSRGLARLAGAPAIAYIQDHTATLVSPDRLSGALGLVASHAQVVAITLGTRPDCLPDPILDALAPHARHGLMVELGLQTSNDRTLRQINRRHTARAFELAVRRLRARGIRTCAHVILGLPTPTRGAVRRLSAESSEDARETARFLAAVGIDAVKLHNCHVLRGTELANLHRRGLYAPPDLEGYILRLIPFLEHLPPHVEIHRVVGDAQPPALLAPMFTANKARALERIRQALDEQDTWQGRLAGAPPDSGQNGATPAC